MKHHPATEAVETITGPHLPRDCARELAASIVENLLAAGWLQPGDLAMPGIDTARQMQAQVERDLAAARMALETRPCAADLAAANYRAKTAERERDEARAILHAADKGSPIFKAVERILDEHSAWIARPDDAVTRAVALAAGIAWMGAEQADPALEEMDAALAAARAENERLRAALEFFASETNWRLGGPFDPNSPSFTGIGMASAALKGGNADA